MKLYPNILNLIMITDIRRPYFRSYCLLDLKYGSLQSLDVITTIKNIDDVLDYSIKKFKNYNENPITST